MKKISPLFVSLPIILALLIGLVSIPASAQELPPGPLMFDIFHAPMIHNLDTVIPIGNGQITNRGYLFRVDGGKIYVTAPGYRVSVESTIACSTGNFTYYQLAVVPRKGNGQSIPSLHPTTIVKARVVNTANTDMYHVTLREFNEDDFSEGEPYLQFVFRHNATNADIGCRLTAIVRAD